MNRREIASLAFKIAGIYCFLQALGPVEQAMIYGAVITTTAPKQPGLFWISGALTLGTLIYVTVGYLLIASSDRWARRLVGDGNMEANHPPASAPDLQAIAFSAIGVYLFLSALPKLVQLAAAIFPSPSNSYGIGALAASTLWTGASVLVQMAAGIWLFFGARKLSVYWDRWQASQRTPEA